MSQVNKPWGKYEDILRQKNVVFKRIEIMPAERISYQTHLKRGEFWYIAEGVGQLRIGAANRPLNNWTISKVEANDTVVINPGVAHQITCLGDSPLIIYEMQYGNCSEEDIIRLEDPYKR